MLLGLGAAAAGLTSIISGVAWWFVVMAVALVVFASGATVRAFSQRRIWPSVVTALSAFGVITLMFAPAQSLLAIIPTPNTFERFGQLQEVGAASISRQSIPADADEGILFLLCIGVAVISIAMDWIAFMLRAPAATGVPLVVLLLVPSFVRSELDNGFYFVLTASVWMAILLLHSRLPGRRMAVGIGAAAVTAGLIVPLGLPPLDASPAGGESSAGFSTGINPIITLGDDLRRGVPSIALTYTSTEADGQYLRLTALDNFSGRSWGDDDPGVPLDNSVDAIGTAPGLGAEVPVTEVTTDISVSNILSRWLPAPYAPTSVRGLVGSWAWDPDALTIRTERSSARGQHYTVESQRIAPSIDQLEAAGTTVESGFERYLDVPDDLPFIVGSTALEVTAGATTHYEKALALQDYFRNGEFTYSEDAPVDNGYDGSGAGVLAAFLDAKSGYCVHFSSAMASMARTLGMPARIAVGFTPGQGLLRDDGTTEYTVTTLNLHAWPELYFANIGWVRFEPTPGRGTVPEFAPLAVDDPATPEVDESVPVVAPTTTPSAAPNLPVDETPVATDPQAIGPGSSTAPTPWWILLPAALVLVFLVPAMIRSVQRMRRLSQATAGSAATAWDEVRDTADDLGLAVDRGLTPRQLQVDLRRHLTLSGVDALGRLRVALEAEAFAEHAGAPDAADVVAVIRSLRRSAGLGSTLLATFAPRSLVARWRPEVVRA
jgi:transglutaminase-like putative cysteine protease